MALLDILKQSGGGDALQSLGRAVGLDASTTEALAKQLSPALAQGMKRRAAQEGGLHQILSQLKGEGRVEYLRRPEAAADASGRAAGEDFLSQIFGDREAAPELARAAAERENAPADKVQMLLPALAAMLQGAMQTRAPDREVDATLSGVREADADKPGAGIGDLLSAAGGSGGALGGLLGAFTGGSGGAGFGGLSAHAAGGVEKKPANAADGLASVLQLLDADGDGSPLDDVVRRFLK